MPIDDLPKFKLCHPVYWKEQRPLKSGASLTVDPNEDISKVKNKLGALFK